MSFTTPRLNSNASRRHARAARVARSTPSRSIQDAVDLISHTAMLAEWYRDEFLPSTLGGLLRGGLASETDALSRAVRTGDLEELVEWR